MKLYHMYLLAGKENFFKKIKKAEEMFRQTFPNTVIPHIRPSLEYYLHYNKAHSIGKEHLIIPALGIFFDDILRRHRSKNIRIAGFN